jgi:hypothetical protein
MHIQINIFVLLRIQEGVYKRSFFGTFNAVLVSKTWRKQWWGQIKFAKFHFFQRNNFFNLVHCVEDKKGPEIRPFHGKKPQCFL